MSLRARVLPSIGAVLAVALATVLGLLSVAAPPVAVAAGDALPGATSLGSSVAYPDVAAGADGVFHAVVRDSSAGTRIVYLRSTDAGRTWVRTAVLSGTLAATRPSIAADGTHVAVTFVGDWTDAAGVHGEAPYLTTSDDGGASWTAARRLGTWATDVDVAVDGDRVWVAWGGAGGIRGTTDGGATFFVSRDLAGVSRALVAAGGGVVSAAYLDGAGNTMTAVGQQEVLGAFATTEHAVLQDVAAADGLAYALVADGADLSVLAASPGGRPARAHVPAPAGAAAAGAAGTTLWADLAAGRGSVAVASCAAGTVFVAESTSWPTFGDPVAATTFAGAQGQDCRATITAPPAGGELEPRFDWSVAPHYVDTDGDGLPEPANASGTPADNVVVGDNDVLRVTLDGCASLPAAGGVPITHYAWSVDGTPVADLDHCAGPTIDVRSGATPQVRLELRDDDGGRAAVSRTIAPRDLVVVSLGDSVASGEGSPLRDQGDPGEVAWTDRSCHRSPYAGPALAARELEDGDPHTAVTFVQLACSGAAIVDTFDDPAHRATTDDADDPQTGGVADAYAGVEQAATCATGGACPSLRPSQLTQLTQLLGPRHADAVLVSVGANDVRFSGTLRSCLLNLVSSCDGGSAAAQLDSRLDELPARYQKLANGLAAAGVAPDAVHLTEYFDPTGDSYGLPDLRCIGRVEDLHAPDLTGLGLVTDDEATWARGHVVAGLNDAVRAAASAHGWDLVSGIAAQFVDHGYCADDPWVVRLGQSLARQDDEFGAFHPDRAGQEAYGDAIYPHLAPLTQTPPTAVGDAAPQGAAAVGDLVVLASDVWAAHPELRSIALTTTGGQPTVGAVRVLQQGAGWGAAALDHGASVGVWAGEVGGYAAQLAARPNATVRAVHLVQGPDDGSRLVAGRKTAVHANLWLAGDGTVTTAVTTTVTAHGDDGDAAVFGPTTEQVALHPGENDVLLPVDQALAAPVGTVLVAKVQVTDPPGASPDDGADNTLATGPGDFVPTIATRPLRVVFVPLDFGEASATCGDIVAQANLWVAWAQQLLPVPDDGVQGDLSCTPELFGTSASPAGVAQALGELDLLARESGVDSVVGVVPDGWLGGALGDGSVARAGVTGRSIVIQAHAPAATLAHELGHNLGLEHSELPAATGAWVSRDRVVHGPDFMSAETDGVSTEWVAGQTWDLLTGAVADGSQPHQPEPGGAAYWVRGTMPLSGDSLALDPFVDDGDIPSPPPADSDTGRLVVVPVAGDGTPTGPAVPVGLTRDESVGGADAAGSATLRFAQKVAAPGGTAAFRFVLDGRTLAERVLGAAPVVTVTAPAAGASLARSDTLHVAWTVTDPDTDPDTGAGAAAPTVNLLVSDDAGATWRPLAGGLAGTSADLAVPQDLGGDAIVVRVVASDGVHVRWADSGAFRIDAAPRIASERVAFVAGDPDVGRQGTGGWAGVRPTWDRLGTMHPDGTDVQFFDLPRDEVDGNPTWTLPTSYSSPVWAPDGRLYVRWGDGRVASMESDGSDLRFETTDRSPYSAFATDSNRRGCLSMSADGNRMLLDLGVLQRTGSRWTLVASLEMFQNNWEPAPGTWNGLFPFTATPVMRSDQCPELSPDGNSVARAFDLVGDGTYPGVAVVSVSGPGDPSFLQWRFVTAARDSTRMAASWIDDHDLLVTRGTAGTDAATLERVDVSALSSTDGPGDDPQLLPAAATPLGTIDWPQGTAHRRAPKLLADGRVYGDARCGLFSGQTTITTTAAAYVPGTSTCFTDFAWDGGGASGGTQGEPMLVLDPAQAPDPAPDAPGEAVVVADGAPAPGAGTDATHPVPQHVGPLVVTIAPGGTTDVALTNDLDAPVRYEVDPAPTQPPGGGRITVVGESDPGTGLVTTSGTLRLVADAATAQATGPARLRVRAAGATAFETIEVRFAAPPRPVAADDGLSVQVGVEATFPAATLLANDTPSVPGAALRLVQVGGFDHGSAFLDADGIVHVTAAQAGTGTFAYAVGQAGSTGHATATVTVSATTRVVPAPTIELSGRSVHRGDTLTVVGSGFAAGEPVTAVLHSAEPFTVGSTTADGGGRIVLAWTVPQGAALGGHTLVVTGTTSGSAQVDLVVLADAGTAGEPVTAAPPDRAGLAVTGTDGVDLLAAACAALLFGAALVAIARGRRARRR